MGADFKEKTRGSFKKSWDKAAVSANTPDLFKKPAFHSANSFEAAPLGEALLAIGESVIIRSEAGRMIGRQGLSPVLVIEAPTEALTQAVVTCGAAARADIVSVDPISGIYEITVH